MKKITIVITFFRQKKHFKKIIELIEKNPDFDFVIVYNKPDKKQFENLKDYENLTLLYSEKDNKKNEKLFIASKVINEGFVIVMDPDDSINFEILRSNRKLFTNQKIIINSFKAFKGDGSLLKIFGKNLAKRKKNNGHISSSHPMHNASVIYSAKLFKEATRNLYGWSDEIMLQDIMLCLSATSSLKDEDISTINVPFYEYILYSNSSNSYSWTNLQKIENYDIHMNELTKMFRFNDSFFFKDSLLMVAYDMATIAIKNGILHKFLKLIKHFPPFSDSLCVKEGQIIFESKTCNYKRKIKYSCEKDLTSIDSCLRSEDINFSMTLFNENFEESVNSISKLNYISNYAETFAIFDRSISLKFHVKLQERFPQILILTNNGNYGKTRSNFNCSQISRTGWIKIIDPDDDLTIRTWDLEKLRKITRTISEQEKNISIIMHSFYWNNINDDLEPRIIKFSQSSGFFDKSYINDSYPKILPFNSSLIYSTRSLNNSKFAGININMHEDILMTIIAAEANEELAYLDIPFYTYNRGNGISVGVNKHLKDSTLVSKILLKTDFSRYPDIYKSIFINHNLRYYNKINSFFNKRKFNNICNSFFNKEKKKYLNLPVNYSNLFSDDKRDVADPKASVKSYKTFKFLENFKLKTYKNDRVYKKIVKDSVARIEYAIRKSNVDRKGKHTIYDLGANIGITSIALSYLFPNSRIISLEPDPRNFALLKQNIKDNKISNVVLVKGAIDYESDCVEIWHDETGSNHWASTTTTTNKISDLKVMDRTKTYTMGFLLKKYGRPNIIKMDIEGAEEKIIKYDLNSLGKSISIIEFHKHDFNIQNYMKQLSDLEIDLYFENNDPHTYGEILNLTWVSKVKTK